MPDQRPHANPEQTTGTAIRGVVAAGLLTAIFILGAVLVSRWATGPSRAAWDQNTYHLPVIRQFERQWPRPDFSDYPSATTPGYHVVLAAAGHWLGNDTTTLRRVGALFTIGLLATLALAVGRRAGTGTTLALCLPLLCSLYVLSSGVWILPDNAGWWGVLGALLIALRPRVDRWTHWLGGLVVLALVMVRQIDLWVAAPLCAAVWLGDGSPRKGASIEPSQDRVRRLMWMLAALVPALAVVGYFFHLWHGTAPPQQQRLVGGGNPAAPAAALAVIGVLGLFYAGYFWPELSQHFFRTARWAIAGGVCGAVVGVIPCTMYDEVAGRYSGIWTLARRLPYVCGRSPVIVGLSIVGGAVVALWLAALPVRDRVVCAVATIAFLAAQASGHYAFQRYYEPLILIAAAATAVRVKHSPARWAVIGPLLLAVLLSAVTAMSLR
ncbi:MAG: hypothetical protein JWL69_1758 [Phycisphaerales bacterium]|nr:hypothetical protein [Phycisphaerales bacterium]